MVFVELYLKNDFMRNTSKIRKIRELRNLFRYDIFVVIAI